MTEPVSQPIFFVVDEDPSAVETLAGDLERRFQADYRVIGETRRRRRWSGWVRCASRASRSR